MASLFQTAVAALSKSILVVGRRALCLSVAFVLFGSTTAWAQLSKTPRLAVFGIDDKTGSLSEKQLQQLTKYLSSKIAASSLFQIIPGSQIKKRLRQKRRESYKSCYDEKCQIEIGRELAANKSLSTTVMKLGSSCTVTSVLYDLRRAASQGAASAEGPCTVGGLAKSITNVVAKLVKRSRPATKKTPSFKGGLFIKSIPPGANAWIDGVKQKGTTPLTLRALAAEEHLLVLRKGRSHYRGMVRVRADKFTTIAATLQKAGGQITVMSVPPEGNVFLDGRSAGKTPTIVKGVVVGTHVVEVRKSGYLTARKTVRVDGQGVDVSATIRLKRAAVLVVKSEPSDAKVLLDNVPIGFTPVRKHIAPGRHWLTLKKERRASTKIQVYARVERKTVISLRLDFSADEKRLQRQDFQERANLIARRWSNGLWGHLALGTGLALVAAAGALYTVAIIGGNDAHQAYMWVSSFDQPALDKHYKKVESSRSQLIIGHVLAGTAVALLAYSIYELITRPEAPTEGVRPAVGIAPILGGAAFTMTGRY